MFEQMRVYHKNHRYGTIVKFEKDTYYIDFGERIEKIFVGSWLKSLFLTAEDSRKRMEDIDLEPYKEILTFDEKIYKATNIYQIRENVKATEIERLKLIPLIANPGADKDITNKFWVEKEYPKNNYPDEEYRTVYDEEINRYEEMMQEETGYFAGFYPGHPDFELDDLVYDAYLKDPYDIDSITKQDIKFDEMSSEINIMNKAKKYVLMPGMVDRNQSRCVALLMIAPIELGRHRFLNIIGIDVSTAKIVTIVDQNGRDYGYHSDNYKFGKLLGQTPLIKALFELLEHREKHNVLRIVSDFEVIGLFDTNTLRGLDMKYNILSQKETRMTTEFKLAAKMPHIHNKKFYMLVNFKDTIIGRNKNSTEFCVKMDHEYPFIRDTNYSSETIVGKHFCGMALVSWNTNRSKNVVYFAEKLFGNLRSEDEPEKEKGIIASQYSEDYDDFIEEYEEYDLQYINSFEKYDETELYNYDEFLDQYVHCLCDQPEYYEDEREECHRMDQAYWFNDDEYVEGKSNENF